MNLLPWSFPQSHLSGVPRRQELELALGRAEWEKPKKPAAKKMPMPKKMPESLQRLGEENTFCVFFLGGEGKGGC